MMDKDTKLRYAVGGLIIGIILIFGLVKSFTKTPDCKEQTTSKIIFLIDQTDPVTQLQNEELKRRILNFLNNTELKNKNLNNRFEIDSPINSYVSIFNLSADYKNLKPIYSGCRIPNGKDVNPITDDVKKIQRDYEKNFLNKFIHYLKIDNKTETSSPILETLSAISRTNFFISDGKNTKTKLIIFSDMIHHSEEFSLYGCKSANDMSTLLKKDNAKIVRNEIESLSKSYINVDVKIHLIKRDKYDSQELPSKQCLDYFWNLVFKNSYERTDL